MAILRKIKSKPVILIFALFLLAHLVLFSVNKVEWGDSYRILRASEYIREFSYPIDEKRPPLYSALLALRPIVGLNPVVWGKGVMLGVSIASFYVFYLLAKEIFSDEETVLISLLLFAFNPVYFYWSIRVYADLFFSLQVLLLAYFYLRWREKLSIVRILALAFISVLSILTRFEGYLLTLSLGLALLFEKYSFSLLHDKICLKWESLKEIFCSDNFRHVIYYGIGVLIFLFPYWLWRNPLSSSYLEEPSGRTYDFLMVVKYGLSLLFLFGFTSAFAFYFARFKKVLNFFKRYIFITIFVVFELLLILSWPAAVPRLFVPVIPLLILPLSKTVSDFFKEDSQAENCKVVFLSFGLFLLYGLAQKTINLQFLIPSFKLVLVVLAINAISLIFIYTKKLTPFLITTAVSLMFWTFSVIYAHKDIYATIRLGVDYARANLQGVVAYNDVSSVSDWYLNEDPTAPQDIKGSYFEYGSSEQLSLENLNEKKYDYLLFTNEHNPNLDVNFQKRPYLEVLRTFNKEINGKIFFTKVVKVKN
jgi:hypothetical protein